MFAFLRNRLSKWNCYSMFSMLMAPTSSNIIIPGHLVAGTLDFRPIHGAWSDRALGSFTLPKFIVLMTFLCTLTAYPCITEHHRTISQSPCIHHPPRIMELGQNTWEEMEIRQSNIARLISMKIIIPLGHSYDTEST
jgi:hypothetical protein